MSERLIDRFLNSELSLREHLASARTIMSNERTFLSYQRTALTEIVAGVSFIKFFDTIWLQVLGWMLVPVSVVTVALGLVRYLRMKRLIHDMDGSIC